MNANHWSSRATFLMATIGVSVGLGNIWRFPYVAGVNGGGAFVLVYLLTILVFALPILMAELMIGRRGQLNPLGSVKAISKENNAKVGIWGAIGIISIAVPFIALAYYSVVAGWAMDYFFKSLAGVFHQLDAEASSKIFDELLAAKTNMLIWHAVFIGLTVLLIVKGLKAGLERAIKILMPSLAIILLLLFVCAIIFGDFKQGLMFLFKPDFSKLTYETVLVAMGQAFFSLGVGAGSVMAYGAYMKQDISIPRTSMVIASADTLVALLAGMVIFPFVFAFGLDVDQGPGLIFVTLPIAFSKIPLGAILASLFFLLLVLAALTTTLSMLECVTRLFEDRFNWKRKYLAPSIGFASYCLGILAVLSFNSLSGVFPLAALGGTFQGKTFFDLMDYGVANILIPLNGLLIVLFTAWVMSKKSTKAEFGQVWPRAYSLWRFSVRFIAPVGILSVFVFGLM